VAYHEAFWIAVAAAAPVVALAAIVAYTDLGRIIGRRPEPGRANPASFKTLAEVLVTGMAVAWINVVLQAVTLLLALLSLAADHDQAPLIIAEITTPLGIFLLLVSGVIGGTLRFLLDSGGIFSRRGHSPGT
jgi:hypothetical protein